MIHALADAVRANLRTRKYPQPVLYGPEPFERTSFDPAIIFSRDRERGDVIGPPVGTKVNPESPYTRVVAGQVVVFAQSSAPGARVQDHEDECDRVCDAVLTAMYEACKARSLPLAITESRLLRASEFSNATTWPGCVAQIRFSVTTLVRRVTYAGAGALTGEVADVVTTVEAEQAPGE